MNNPRRVSWDPEPNFYLVILDWVMILLALQSPQAVHTRRSTITVPHAAWRQGGWGGLEVVLGEAAWLDLPVYSLLEWILV